jgi:septum formation topological specificity factor MinE
LDKQFFSQNINVFRNDNRRRLQLVITAEKIQEKENKNMERMIKEAQN